MDLELLSNKINIKKNGIDMTDILTASVKYQGYDYVIIDGFYIGEDLEMRADLLSQTVYGNTHNWDIILKFNGISNPFALSREDFILIPELGWMDAQLYDPIGDDPAQDVRSQYLDTTKSSTIDPKKQEYNKLVKDLYSVNRNAVFNKIPLPPNLAQFGEGEIKIIDGSIILGPNVSSK